MRKKLLWVIGLGLMASACVTANGSPFFDPNQIFLNNETPATHAAYQAWIDCGVAYVNSHNEPRGVLAVFDDPVAKAAVDACAPQERLVMSQIRLDAYHKNWMHRNYYHALAQRHELNHPRVTFGPGPAAN